MCCSLPSIELGMPRTQQGDSWRRFLRTHPTPPDPFRPVLHRKGLKGLGSSSSRRVRALATHGYGGEVKHLRSGASSRLPRISRATMGVAASHLRVMPSPLPSHQLRAPRSLRAPRARSNALTSTPSLPPATWPPRTRLSTRMGARSLGGCPPPLSSPSPALSRAAQAAGARRARAKNFARASPLIFHSF